MRLFHFSEEPNISVFRPRPPSSAPDAEAFVWAIDEQHAPSYWFPRDCPRACCWHGGARVNGAGLLELGGARRLHAIEAGWLERVRNCWLYVYEFDPAPFTSKVSDAGYWVASQDVSPISVAPVGDLLAKHAAEGIELRIVRNLWPLIDAIVASGLEYSIIRKGNAQPRIEPLWGGASAPPLAF